MLGEIRFKRSLKCFICIIPMILFLQGCGAPVSSDMATDSMYASIMLTCMNDGTTDVEVRLSVSNSTGANIFLVNGDRLDAVVNNQSYPLTREDDFPNIVRYLTTVSGDAPGTQVTIDFIRPNYIPAPGSQVNLPEHSAIASPQSGEVFPLNGQIDVQWDPYGFTNQATVITFEITCRDDQGTSGSTQRFEVQDSGQESFAVQDLMDGWELGPNPTCDATISLIRTTTGTVASEFRNGRITASRTTSVEVKIQP